MIVVRDHPRSRGVYPQNTTCTQPDPRIIPARAGFTPRSRRCWPLCSDHPRSRGVYSVIQPSPSSPHGSSPLARGLLDPAVPIVSVTGIIPARAGFTPPPPAPAHPARDHPRSRGVYSACHRIAGGCIRIIPARAGFTFRARPRVNAVEDHPRSRGVYSSRRAATTASRGSSPLARGLPQ